MIAHVYRWDLDKTYLKTEFDTLLGLVRTAFESAADKRNVPGTAVLLRELRAHGPQPNRISIISGSPRQLRRTIEEKLRLDGIEVDELVLKPNVSNALRGRFRAVRGQVGYKLPALLESRVLLPASATETLFGDDAEADAFVYSLYADLVAGRVDDKVLERILEEARVYPDDAQRTLALARRVERAEPVGRIFINLDRRTPPARFAAYGPRLVPIYNYFQAALVLLADGHLGVASAIKVAAELVARHGHNLVTLANSLQDLVRRGFGVEDAARKVSEALATEDPLVQLLRPAPDIVAAFARRLGSLGVPKAPPSTGPVDFLALVGHARPR